MVKAVTRHVSHDNTASTTGGQTSQPLSQNSTNQKLFQRIRSSKVEKTNTVANLATTSNSGNKNAYQAQSAAARSMSQNVGQSTADTVKAGESHMAQSSLMANM